MEKIFYLEMDLWMLVEGQGLPPPGAEGSGGRACGSPGAQESPSLPGLLPPEAKKQHVQRKPWREKSYSN